MKPALANPARIILLAGPALVVGAIWAQATTPAFEVASIRAAEFPNPGRGGGGPQQFRAGMHLDATRLDWGFASPAEMIQYAFGVKNYQVSGPDWMRSSRWNVVARLPEGASQDQVPRMMQALLAERFQLKVHREKREQPVYALELAKGGPRLEAIAPSNDDSTAQAPAGASAPGLFPGPFGRGPGGPPPDAPDGRGGRGPGPMITTGVNGATSRLSPGDGCAMHLELSKLTMQDLADTLAPFLDKPVIDATELKGMQHAKPCVYGLSAHDARLTLCETTRTRSRDTVASYRERAGGETWGGGRGCPKQDLRGLLHHDCKL